MATVRTVIFHKEYTLGCDDGQEAQLLELTEKLSARCGQLSQHLGRVPESLLLVYAALTFIDEAQEAKKQVGELSRNVATHGDDAQLHAVQETLAHQLIELAGKIESIASTLEETAA